MFESVRDVPEPSSAPGAVVSLAIALWILAVLVVIAAAVWMYRDAEARGKSGIFAGLLALLTVFYGIPATLSLICAWILLRPDLIRRHDVTRRHEDPLPDQLSPDIEAAPTSEEFLEGLHENG